ncbi:hypothetical protein L9F63_025256, partial [Diploptera punctata]
QYRMESLDVTGMRNRGCSYRLEILDGMLNDGIIRGAFRLNLSSSRMESIRYCKTGDGLKCWSVGWAYALISKLISDGIIRCKQGMLISDGIIRCKQGMVSYRMESLDVKTGDGAYALISKLISDGIIR